MYYLTIQTGELNLIWSHLNSSSGKHQCGKLYGMLMLWIVSGDCQTSAISQESLIINCSIFPGQADRHLQSRPWFSCLLNIWTWAHVKWLLDCKLWGNKTVNITNITMNVVDNEMMFTTYLTSLIVTILTTKQGCFTGSFYSYWATEIIRQGDDGGIVRSHEQLN